MKAFLTIIMKELMVFLRNFGLVVFVLYSFTFDIYTAGEGIKVTPQNVAIGYVDKTNSGLTTKIFSHFHSPEFKTPKPYLNEKALKKAIFDKEIMVGLSFDKKFEKTKQINVLIDATTASQAQITIIYLQNILLKFVKLNLPVVVKSHILFNQNANSKWFMGLSEMMSVIMMLGLILTAIVFVKEKERGTWDIMLLMPVDSQLIILAKVISQILILMVGTIISVGVILFLVFHLPMNGNFWLFIFLTFLFMLSVSGIALFIAAVSNSIMEVSQYTVMIMMPILFLSGAWTPIHSMLPIFQKMTYISPLRYYIDGCESIFFRGSDFMDIWPDFAGVFIIGVILFAYGFRKLGKLF
jgi:ABC-2 type transport system permease protein